MFKYIQILSNIIDHFQEQEFCYRFEIKEHVYQFAFPLWC